MPVGITSAEVEQMRKEAASYLSGMCTISRDTETGDGQGGTTKVWANLYTSVPCRLSPISGAGGDTANQFQVRTTWRMAIPYSIPALAGDRVIYGDHTYTITAIEDDHDNRTLRTLALTRVE
jgi:SPP1 family predicted phage head-tail adaptor